MEGRFLFKGFALYPREETDARPRLVVRDEARARELAGKLDAECCPVVVLLGDERKWQLADHFTFEEALRCNAAVEEADNEKYDVEYERGRLAEQIEERDAEVARAAAELKSLREDYKTESKTAQEIINALRKELEQVYTVFVGLSPLSATLKAQKVIDNVAIDTIRNPADV